MDGPGGHARGATLHRGRVCDDQEISMSFFLPAFKIVVGIEGGYSNDPRDPGGETKFGISKNAYPNLDIASLTLEQAQQIYLRDYWDACGCDTMTWER